MDVGKEESFVGFLFLVFFPGPLCLAAACHDAMFCCCVGARPPFLGMLCTPGGFLNNYETWARRVPYKAAANLERWFGGAPSRFILEQRALTFRLITSARRKKSWTRLYSRSLSAR